MGKQVGNRRCLGFGPYEGNCSFEPGTPWTPWWCWRCDDLRRAQITRELEQLAEEAGVLRVREE